MPVERLKEYLDHERVNYNSVRHYETFTAQETAESAHIPGRELAKTVVVKIDGKMAMAVLPASKRLSLGTLKAETGAGRVELATEEEFTDAFPDCEIGAMPPFGNLYGMEVYVDESLAEDAEISFNAGDHIELIKMSYSDFARLVRPKVFHLSSPVIQPG